MKKLKRILDKNNIKYKFKEPDLKEYEYDGKKYKYLDNGGIDHCGETRKFVTTVLDNEDMLMRLLFGNSFVYTGNDNSNKELDGCDIALPDWDDFADGRWKTILNPYHDSENYDYFFKGN